MATTTAAVIISDALKEIVVIGEGETPSASMYSDGLRMLNRLLDTFSNKADFAFDQSLRSLALTGQSSFDVGPSGDIVTLRPIQITSAYATLSLVDYPVEIISVEQYDDISLKTTTGSIPEYIAYNGIYPDGVVYVYPLCSGVTINLRTVDQVKTFATTATQIDMPEGYEDAIMLALAIRMAPSYGKQINPETKIAANRAMNAVKVTNQVIPTMDLPNAVMSSVGSSYADFMSGN
jgi:hypothetical protein